MFITNFCLNMFRAPLCPSSGEQRPCYCIWCVVLVCWMWLVAVVGRCVVRCEQCPHRTTYGSHLVDCLTYDDVTILCSVKSQKCADLIYTAPEAIVHACYKIFVVLNSMLCAEPCLIG